jgi:hypothetical protein
MIIIFFISIFFFINSVYSQSNIFESYPFLSKDHNFIQFYNKSSLEKFFTGWEDVKNRKLVVVHIGDSHLQNDAFPGRIRKNLQDQLGYGGRGIMFPYSAAKTYSNHSYHTDHTGDWEFSKNIHSKPKLPLGLSGMSVKTTIPESQLRFTFKTPEPDHYQILKVFYKLKSSNAYIQVGVDSNNVEQKLESLKYPYSSISIPSIQNSLSFTIKSETEEESEIYFYGMSLESINHQGIIWHNCGVDGARYKSILQSKLFGKQLKSLEPDLVILDLGTNEYAVGDSIPPQLEEEIHLLIDRIKSSSPNVSIILNSTQDMSYKGKNLKSGRSFLKLIKKIAKETNSAFYDFYSVAGGDESMELWYENKLARKDFIHLTNEGYYLKGDLYSSAIIDTMEAYKTLTKKSLLIKSIQ